MRFALHHVFDLRFETTAVGAAVGAAAAGAADAAGAQWIGDCTTVAIASTSSTTNATTTTTASTIATTTTTASTIATTTTTAASLTLTQFRKPFRFSLALVVNFEIFLGDYE
jgi:hypothetical protein